MCSPMASLNNNWRFFMRKLVPLSVLAAAVLLFGGVAANAQQKDTPAKAQGAGAECSRMTDAKARDNCVKAQKTDKASKDTGKSAAAKDDKTKGKKN
jgi:hypothetical protein